MSGCCFQVNFKPSVCDGDSFYYFNPNGKTGSYSNLDVTNLTAGNLIVYPGSSNPATFTSLPQFITINTAIPGGNGNVLWNSQIAAIPTTGIDNTGIGLTCLTNLTTGSYNTATGLAALEHCTTGANNAAFGFNILSFCYTGDNNVGLGSEVFCNNETQTPVTGNGNIGIGVNVAPFLTSGSNNLCICPAGGCGGLTTGSNNLMIGDGGATTGNNNIFINYIPSIWAGCTGSGNTCLSDTGTGLTSGNENFLGGHRAGTAISTGNYNIAIGGYNSITNTLGTLTTGSNCSALGAASDVSSSSASYRTVIGSGAINSNDNSI